MALPSHANIFLDYIFHFYYNTWIRICKDIRENKRETIHEKCRLLAEEGKNSLKNGCMDVNSCKNSNFCRRSPRQDRNTARQAIGGT